MVKIVIFVLDAVRYDDFKELFTINKCQKEYYMKFFNNVYAASSWTLPSIVSFFSGTYPFTYENFSFSYRPCLIKFIKSEGFKTILINSGNAFIELAGLPKYFDQVIEPPMKKMANENVINILGYLKSVITNKRDFLNKLSLARNILNDFSAVIDTYAYILKGIPPYWLINELLSKLTKVIIDNRSDNLFIYVHVMDVHHPWRALPKFKNKTIDILFATFVKYLNTMSLPARFLRLMHDIYRESLKESIMLLTEFLESIFFQDDIVIVLTADHGEGFSIYNKFDRFHEVYTPNMRIYNLFYDQLHIPLVFITNYERAEIALKDIEDNMLMSSIDILPLTMYISGVDKLKLRKINRYLDSNLLNLIENKNHIELRRTIFAESPAYRRRFNFYEKTYSVIEGEGYKLTLSPFDGLRLTNIVKDKYERFHLEYDDILMELYTTYKSVWKLRRMKSLRFSLQHIKHTLTNESKYKNLATGDKNVI